MGGIRNRGSLVHKDKTKYTRKDKHDVLPSDDIPIDDIEYKSGNDMVDSKLPHQDRVN